MSEEEKEDEEEKVEEEGSGEMYNNLSGCTVISTLTGWPGFMYSVCLLNVSQNFLIFTPYVPS